MFVFNYSDSPLKVAKNGNVQTLCPNTLQYVDESWVTFDDLKNMFGRYVGLANPETPIEKYFFDNQQALKPDKLYLVSEMGTGTPRLFIKGGAVDVNFSDSEYVPTQLSDLIKIYDDVDGLVVLDKIARYMTITVSTIIDTGVDIEIVASNLKCFEKEDFGNNEDDEEGE